MSGLKELIGLIFGIFLIVIVIALIAVGVSWFVRANELEQQQVFVPKEEAVRRQTFETSKAFIDGTITEMQNMQVDYVKTNDPNAKKVLASVILHRADSIDERRLPDDLAVFVRSLRQNPEK